MSGYDGAYAENQDQEMMGSIEEAEAELSVVQGRQKSQGNRRRNIIIGVVLLCIVAVVIGVVVATSGGSSSSSSNAGAVGDSVANSPDDRTDDSTSSPAASPTVPSSPSLSPMQMPTGDLPVTSAPTTENAKIYGGIIRSVARKGGAEFDDKESYQSKALAWVSTLDLPSGQKLTLQEEVVQLYAVACIYYSTYAVRNGWTDVTYKDAAVIPGWFANGGWLQKPSIVCFWYGLSCDSQGRISAIKLDRNGLTGSFPDEVVLLKDSLKSIDLFKNTIHNRNDEGNSFLGELTNLEELFYGSTFFEHSGGIPTELGLLTKLTQIDFSYTYYDGPLDGAIFKDLVELQYLRIAGSSFDSTFPDEIATLPKLEYVLAGNAMLKGDLSFISKMPAIRELWLDDNLGFAGSTIPTEIGTVSALASFSVAGCGIKGTIPTEIGNLRQMKQLWLYNNELEGEIPEQINMLFNLENLQLEKNNLIGSIPNDLCDIRIGRPSTFTKLEADCEEGGQVSCKEGCCTCCGAECAGSD
mmetsp:Transcript_17688/g.50120  ORF Transcript_17688/g.50120 Transcript_17688/m.50120 type:complete len:525 (+) Transcript_17688:121-1695(+)